MKIKSLFAIPLIFSLLTSVAFAFDADHVQRLLTENECVECDLRDADLRGAGLKDADIRWAKLNRADLRGADLRRANLQGATLSGANLGSADLTGAIEVNLAGARLDDNTILPNGRRNGEPLEDSSSEE